MAGYEAGRAMCARTGSAELARRWTTENRWADAAYLAGLEWSIWDYEDANGLLREPIHRPAG